MINQDYKKALSELCKLKKIGILNKKNNDRWLACLETITDNRRIIIKNLHTVIRSELFINLLPKNVYEYFKDDLSFEKVDTFFRNLQEYYSDKKENTELQRLRTEFNIAKQKILKLENDTYEKRECKNILCNAVVENIVKPAIKEKTATAKNAVTQNDKLQKKPVVNINPFTMFESSKELQQTNKAINFIAIKKTKNSTSIYEILQDYFDKKGIVYNYPDNITLSNSDMVNLTIECEKFLKIEIGENILDCKNTDDFIRFVSKIIENN